MNSEKKTEYLILTQGVLHYSLNDFRWMNFVIPLFFVLIKYKEYKEWKIIKTYSEIFGTYYEVEDTRKIVNMKQNYKYLNSGKATNQLVDIICGDNDMLVFVWKKSEVMDELYDLWCRHEL